MPNISLKEWINTNPNIEVKRQLLYSIDRNLKEAHTFGRTLSDVNADTIYIDTNNNVQFLGMGLNNDVQRKKNDIYLLAALSLGCYMGEPERHFNPIFLQQNFDDYKYLFPEADVDYYRRIFVDNDRFYYSDYIDYQNKNKQSQGKGTAMSYVKTTPQGSMLTEKDDRSLNNAAFINVLIYPAIITLATLTITIMLAILSYFG